MVSNTIVRKIISLKIFHEEGYNSGSDIYSTKLKYMIEYARIGNITVLPIIVFLIISRYCLLYPFSSLSHGHGLSIILYCSK